MIRAIIVDDEQPAVEKLTRLLKESGVVDIKGKFTDPVEALEYIKSMPIDAAFLDIEMPKMNGIELANLMLDLNVRIAIVFVTAYNEYAVEAFRLNAIDYLIKPLNREHLKETLNRIIEQMNIQIYPAKPKICCLGRFEVITEQGKVSFRTAKAEELLAYFVDSRGAEISRSEIIDRMWGEFDGDRAVTHFNTTLYYMKKALLNKGMGKVIERVRNRYRLKVDKMDCDYYKFMSFVSSMNVIDESNIVECEEAVALYSGDYLSGSEFPWAARNRIAIKEKYINLIISMADYYKALNQFDRAITLLKTGLMHEPLHNILNYKIIDTLLHKDDRFSAVQYYNIYKEGLKKELGMKPNSEVKKLIQKAKQV